MVLARPKESKDWVRDLNVFPKCVSRPSLQGPRFRSPLIQKSRDEVGMASSFSFQQSVAGLAHIGETRTIGTDSLI